MGMYKFSFYKKIQATFILLILLPISVIYLLSYKTMRGIVIEKIELSNQSVLELVSKDLTKFVDDLNYVTHFYVENDDTIKSLRDFSDTDRISTYQDYENYQKVVSSFDFIAIKMMSTDINMFIVNNKGFIIPYSDIVSGKTTSIEVLNDHWKSLKPRLNMDQSTHLQWLGAISDTKEKGDSYYYLSRVIHDPTTGKQLAILNIGISKQYFEKLFQSAKTGKLALFDENGKKIVGDSSLSYEKKEKNSGEIRNEVMIPISKWELVHKTTKEEVTGQITKTFFLSTILITLFIFVFLFISLLIAKRLNKPIQKLTFVASQFGKGKHDVRFLPEGNDEINELGKTINNMLDEIQKLIKNIEREQEEKRAIELQALFAQIRPHFLLNTLNSIKCSLFIHNDNDHADKINALMSLLRAYMKIDKPSTIESECKLLFHYIEIMKMRTDVKIELKLELEDKVKEIEIPKLLLQPFIENAIVHGFAEKTDGEITVIAYMENGSVIIVIKDNGKGMGEDQLNTLNTLLKSDAKEVSYQRVGLLNVAKRVKLSFGPNANIHLALNEMGGISISISLPISADKEVNEND
jgi:sensor histidine kinase YesM